MSFFGSLFGAIKGAVGGFIGGGPVGAVIGAVGGGIQGSHGPSYYGMLQPGPSRVTPTAYGAAGGANYGYLTRDPNAALQPAGFPGYGTGMGFANSGGRRHKVRKPKRIRVRGARVSSGFRARAGPAYQVDPYAGALTSLATLGGSYLLGGAGTFPGGGGSSYYSPSDPGLSSIVTDPTLPVYSFDPIAAGAGDYIDPSAVASQIVF